MLKVIPALSANYYNSNNKVFNQKKSVMAPNVDNKKEYNPAYYMPNNISFGKRIVPFDIGHASYLKLTAHEKDFLRTNYENFYKLINIDELYWSKGRTVDSKLPLTSDADMKDFLNVASSYNKYRPDKSTGNKGNRIICLGRSPKWFLSASLWMKGGIQDYTFTAFSSNWYHRNASGVGERLFRDDLREPTIEQAFAYKKYLKRIDCTPADLVESANKTGKPVIITDYIHSGCGVTSWLDLMSKYAKDDGVLDDFAKSIRLHTISSNDYIDNVLEYHNAFSNPRVLLPSKLEKYSIPQDYHDMSAEVLKSMLVDKNTNECRSTFYSPQAWTIYSPEKFKIAQMTPEELKSAYDFHKKYGGIFPDMDMWTDAMKDYRNMMNFRILDYLSEHGMLDIRHIND
jgi:hypothetical protein